MQKTGVLHVVTKLELGGAQKQLLGLLGRLDKERFDLFLFTAKDGILLSEATSINNIRLKKSIFLERPINPFKDILALIELCCFIKKHAIDIVHTHSSKAGILGRLAAKFSGVKCIIHSVHGWSFNDYQPSFYRRLFMALERIVAEFTDSLVVACDYDKQKGLRHNIGVPEKYALVRYGIDYSEFNGRKHNTERGLGINPEELVVTNISCFKPQKSPLDFVRLAFLVNQRVPNVKFIFAGDGILRDKIEAAVSEFGLQERVILCGWRRDIPGILSGTDVLVLTSLWEGLPVAVLEAMSCGLPVVATNTGGIQEVLIEGETGFLVPAEDMEQMSEKLCRLLKDSALRKTVGERAKNFLEDNFTIENMVCHYADLYESLLAKKASGYN